MPEETLPEQANQQATHCGRVTWKVFGWDGLFVGLGCRRTLFLLRDSQTFSGSHLSGVDDSNRLSSHPCTDRKPHPAQEFGRSDLYHSGPCYCCCANGDTWESSLPVRSTRCISGLSERSAEQGGWNLYATHFVDRLSGWAGHYVDVSKLDLRGALVRSLEQTQPFFVFLGIAFREQHRFIFRGSA